MRPSGTIPVTVAVAISTMAMLLASCSVTSALVPSGEMAMYSGSRSCATVVPAEAKAGTDVNRRTPLAISDAA